METTSKYNIVKGIIIALGLIGPFFTPLPDHSDFLNPAPWNFMAIMFGVGIFSVVVFDVTPMHTGNWMPSWWTSLRFSTLVGWSFLAESFSMAVIGLSHNPKNWFFELPLSIALGMLITVKILVSYPPVNGVGDD